MAIQVFELHTDDITEVNNSAHAMPHNYEHLRHYLQKHLRFPAIHVQVTESGIIATRGSEYLRIAKDLGRKEIRAIIERSSDAAAVEKLKGTRRQIPQSEWDEKFSPGLERIWHVFFFDPPINDSIIRSFRTVIEDAFRPEHSEIIKQAGGVAIQEFKIDSTSGLIEFEVDTPLSDEYWRMQFIQKCREFGENKRKIATYQGRVWE